jgi:Flp pilus assembly protein TadG
MKLCTSSPIIATPGGDSKPRAQVSAKRKARSSGQNILEGVFTLLPTFALIFAITDFGLMIFRWTTLQNAVREGSRYAITFQTATGLGQDASIEAVVQSYGLGFVKTTDSPQTIYVKYYSTSNMNTAISSGGNVPGNIVEVSVQGVSYGWLAPLSGSYSASTGGFLRQTTPLTLNIFSSDILGGYPVGVTSVAE